LKMLIFARFFGGRLLTSKVGQSELYCSVGVQSGFISVSVRTRLQVSVCIGYDLCHQAWLTHRQTVFDQLVRKAQPAEQKTTEFHSILFLLTYVAKLSELSAYFGRRWLWQIGQGRALQPHRAKFLKPYAQSSRS